MKNWKFSLTTCLANPIKLKDAFWTITPCCASRCRGQSCGRTLIKWDSCIWMDQAKETTSMYTFQAVIRKGKPNWFCFFTLWLSSRITTDAAQISLWHVYSSFASPLKPLYFGFWSSLENLAFLGNHTFSVSLDCPSVCLTYSYSYSPSRRPQSIWQRTILAVSCLFFFFLVELMIAENTTLLCHDTLTCAGSAWFPWALQSVRGGEGKFLFPSSLVLSSE